jgi:8-oxo-dGTP diphosphatase
MNQTPQVGVAVFVCRDDQFIMGLRRGAHGQGTWSLPGGHLEYAESFERAAAREVFEETSVAIGNVRIAAVTNDLFEGSGRHYVTVWAVADYRGGTPQTREPDKYTDLTWVSAESLPEPLFQPWDKLLSVISVRELLSSPSVAVADLG